jgi:hypothetical protein
MGDCSKRSTPWLAAREQSAPELARIAVSIGFVFQGVVSSISLVSTYLDNIRFWMKLVKACHTPCLRDR